MFYLPIIFQLKVNVAGGDSDLHFAELFFRTWSNILDVNVHLWFQMTIGSRASSPPTNLPDLYLMNSQTRHFWNHIFGVMYWKWQLSFSRGFMWSLEANAQAVHWARPSSVLVLKPQDSFGRFVKPFFWIFTKWPIPSELTIKPPIVLNDML